ncbi:MAG: oligosaccharide flippase family protein, partial [Oscillospiraceae bacterium]|nr:oligosaccharide flippase family protein [Oscillospiraceae bacterium]
FITYQLPTGILTELKNNIPSLLIKPLFGVNMLGQYSASTRLIAMPVNLIGTSIGKVLFQTSSDMVRSNKSIGKFTYKSAIISMKLAIIPVIIILALGDILFKIYLGPDWNMAGNIVRILSIQAFFLFLSICLQGIPISINKQKYAMLFCVAQIFAIISSLTIGTYLFNNIYIGLIIFVASFSLINIVYFSLLFKAMNILPYKYIFRSLLYILIVFICYLIIRIPMIMFGLVNNL